jgi:osmotically-inducible protein OsmY
MRGHYAITASGVLAAHIESRAGFSGIHLSSSSGRLPPDDSIDRQLIDEDNPTMCERIRETIVADKSLSLYAQNIEIFASPGGVTLYGPVKSHEEKKRIEIDVAAVVKAGKVFNKLVVRPSQNLSKTKSSQLREPHEEPEEEYSRIRRLWGIRERPGL